MKIRSVGKSLDSTDYRRRTAADSLSFLQQQLNEFLLPTCRRSSISPSHDAPVQPPAQNQSQWRKMKLHKAGVKFTLTEVWAFYLNPFHLVSQWQRKCFVWRRLRASTQTAAGLQPHSSSQSLSQILKNFKLAKDSDRAGLIRHWRNTWNITNDQKRSD